MLRDNTSQVQIRHILRTTRFGKNITQLDRERWREKNSKNSLVSPVHFQSLEVVCRGSETQLQVTEFFFCLYFRKKRVLPPSDKSVLPCQLASYFYFVQFSVDLSWFDCKLSSWYYLKCRVSNFLGEVLPDHHPPPAQRWPYVVLLLNQRRRRLCNIKHRVNIVWGQAHLIHVIRYLSYYIRQLGKAGIMSFVKKTPAYP